MDTYEIVKTIGSGSFGQTWTRKQELCYQESQDKGYELERFRKYRKWGNIFTNYLNNLWCRWDYYRR